MQASRATHPPARRAPDPVGKASLVGVLPYCSVGRTQLPLSYNPPPLCQDYDGVNLNASACTPPLPLSSSRITTSALQPASDHHTESVCPSSGCPSSVCPSSGCKLNVRVWVRACVHIFILLRWHWHRHWQPTTSEDGKVELKSKPKEIYIACIHGQCLWTPLASLQTVNNYATDMCCSCI